MVADILIVDLTWIDVDDAFEPSEHIADRNGLVIIGMLCGKC